MADSAEAIEVDGLVVRRGPVTAVDGISFSVATGSTTLLLGPNGAGKTSTVEHLEGYLPRAAGTATIFGTDPEHGWAKLAPRVGLMLQQGGIPTAIRPTELLRQYASFFEGPMRADELLELVGLTARAHTPYRRLSGGEQQRLSLALALVGRPELLFLDEPTAGVDLEGRDLIRNLIRDLARDGTTILMTTHDLAEAEQLADKVLIIDHGRIVADATPAELMATAEGEHVNFAAGAGIDVVDLGASVGAAVTEVAPGEYRVDAAPTPDVVAAITTWLARHDHPIGDLRAGRKSIEDVFRRLTQNTSGSRPDGSAAAPGATGAGESSSDEPADGDSGQVRRSRARGRRSRGGPRR
ncbi:MAG: ABC transporter ATP-binding protein [Microthrixaceae bacterium]